MLRRAVIVILIAVAWTLLTSNSPAYAHALVEFTQPANNARLTNSPNEVLIRFSEDVEISPDSTRVLDARGNRVDAGPAEHPNNDGTTVRIPLKSLSDGGYVATWRVVSPDSHPVRGAVAFQVGSGTLDTAALSEQFFSETKGDRTVGIVFGVLRAVMFALIAVVVGSVVYALAVTREVLSRQKRFLAGSAVALGFISLLSIVLQTLYVSGLPFADLNWQMLRSTVDTTYGTGALLRLVLSLLFIAALLLVKRFQTQIVLLSIFATGIVISLTIQGHARSGRHLAVGFLADIVHVAAASAWIGGLVLLLLSMRSYVKNESKKFSAMALWAVALVAVSGLMQGWRQLASLDGLFSSEYGRILLIKVILVIVVIALGWLARRSISNAVQTKQIVLAEAALSVGIFAATSLLVNAVPASAQISKPFSGELIVGAHLVDVVVDPAKVGTNTIHLYVLSKQGLPVDVLEVTASLGLPDQEISPIKVPMTHVGLGHWASYGFSVPLSGDWLLEANLRTTEINIHTNDITVPFR